MAYRVDLDKTTLKNALEDKIKSVKRASTGAKPAFAELYEKEITELRRAIDTLQETK